MASLRAGLLVVLFVAAAAAREGCEAEDEVLLQVTKVDTMAGSRVAPKTWKSPRDLAYVPPPQTVKLSSFLNISIYSAVPSFGRDGNFIALLQDGDEGNHTRNLRRHLSENSLFCSDDSDDNGTFRSQVHMYGMGKPILVCEWPEKDAQLETYQVRLENSKGEKLGAIVAQHKPQLLKDQDYKVVACVRDVFEDQTPDGPNHGKEQFSGPFKQLVEWLEFSSLHGVDHFFVYTFQGTEAVAEDVLQPYLKSGLATRIHFQHYPGTSYTHMDPTNIAGAALAAKGLFIAESLYRTCVIQDGGARIRKTGAVSPGTSLKHIEAKKAFKWAAHVGERKKFFTLAACRKAIQLLLSMPGVEIPFSGMSKNVWIESQAKVVMRLAQRARKNCGASLRFLAYNQSKTMDWEETQVIEDQPLKIEDPDALDQRLALVPASESGAELDDEKAETGRLGALASTTRRQLNMANDCLYRAKSHAKWLMPTIDADEYFHLNLAELFPQTKVPVDYLNSVWDRIVLKNNYALNQVSSVYFNKIRFARAPLDQLDISSKWREIGVERNTKYVANVNQVHEVKTHKSADARPNTVRLRLLQQLGFMGHYRVDQHHRVNYNETWFMKDERASIEDPALLSDVPLIEERIRKRFGQDPKVLLKSLVARRPPSTYEVAQLLITSPATVGA